jgi:hypothetical protein
VKSDQIVVGWRGTPGKEGSTIGLHVWTPLDAKARNGATARWMTPAWPAKTCNSPISMATESSTSSPPAARRRT